MASAALGHLDGLLSPVVTALCVERLREETAGVPQHRDEQVDLHQRVADARGLPAEVDLHLLPRLRLETHRGDVVDELLASGFLHRPNARVHALVPQLLVGHDGIPLRHVLEQLLRTHLVHRPACWPHRERGGALYCARFPAAARSASLPKLAR